MSHDMIAVKHSGLKISIVVAIRHCRNGFTKNGPELSMGEVWFVGNFNQALFRIYNTVHVDY